MSDLDKEFAFLSGQAFSYVRAINTYGNPVVCPLSLVEKLREFPEFAKLIDEGKIIPNAPVSAN